jgi:hypothetical protein
MARGVRIVWTAADDALLRYMRRQCIGPKACADVFGCSVASVRNRVVALGLPPINSVWTPEMDRALIDLRAQGKGLRTCAARIGVDIHTCRKRLAVLDLPRFRRGRPPGGGQAWVPAAC